MRGAVRKYYNVLSRNFKRESLFSIAKKIRRRKIVSQDMSRKILMYPLSNDYHPDSR